VVRLRRGQGCHRSDSRTRALLFAGSGWACLRGRGVMVSRYARLRGERRSSTARGLVLLLALLGSTLFACVGGHIPPSMFEFENVVPYTPPGPGGWKAAQVLILLHRISSVFPQSATCDIEVGVPEKYGEVWVTNEFAQVEAAKAADHAARRVLREHQPTALACIKFREHMQSILRDRVSGPIPGATVTRFRTSGISPMTFP